MQAISGNGELYVTKRGAHIRILRAYIRIFLNLSVMCVTYAFPHSLGQFSMDWDKLTILLPIHSVIPRFAWFGTKLVTPIISKAELARLGVNSVDSATSIEKHLIKYATIIVEKGVA